MKLAHAGILSSASCYCSAFKISIAIFYTMRSQTQVPWRALQSQPVVVEVSNVWLCASNRKEEEWEEDLATRRLTLVDTLTWN